MTNRTLAGTPGAWRRSKPVRRRSAWLGIEVPVSVAVVTFYTVVFVLPFLFSIFLSFHNWDFVGERIFVALKNFQRLFSDPLFWGGLRIALKFSAVFLAVAIVGELLLAVALRAVRGRGHMDRVLLALFFMPSVTPWVASVIIWRWMLSPTNGLVNAMLGLVGIPRQPLIGGNTQALYCIILIMLWRYLGTGAVIFLAGLNEIPESLFEAAKIDGANRWQEFWLVTLPLLQPVLLFQMVTSVIGLLQVFEPFYLITHGGPGHSTRVLPLYIYNTAFDTYNFGYASAMSLALFLIILVFTVAQLRLMRPRWEY